MCRGVSGGRGGQQSRSKGAKGRRALTRLEDVSFSQAQQEFRGDEIKRREAWSTSWW